MKFERLKELKEICEKQYDQEACYFSSLKEGSCDQVYYSWESDLQKLSSEAWSLFRDDLYPALFSESGCGWKQLVKKINKAKGYAYLHEKTGCDQVNFIARSRKNELEFPCWIGKKDQIVYPCEMVTISISDYVTKKIVPIIDKAKTCLINYQSENVGESILFVIIEDPTFKYKLFGDPLTNRFLQIKSYILNLIHNDNITLEIGCLDVDNKLRYY